ncbi:HlyD family secretion protein [Alphaproteobacteria bacterium]|nr:HlyD family secretion protein [Alphaproteobacteria bacterium]
MALSNKLKELMQLSLDYQFTKNSLAIGLEVQEQISYFMTSIEAKGEAGVIPLINVRRAKLLSIDFEGQVEKTKNQLDRIEKEITTSFSLIPSDIVHFPQLFEQHRPIELPFFNENTSIAVASLGFEISAMMNENQAISLENKPIVYGTVTSSVFDLRDFEEEYEIIGELSVSMPLYDGVISALHLKTIGGFVSEGSVLAELIPESTAVLIRAKILTKDLAEVRIGQLATISLTSYDRAQYGHLEGVVTHIARNVTEVENTPPYYETEIKLTSVNFSNTGIQPDLAVGMELSVDILGGKRTILGYIMSPIMKAANTVFREI